MSEEERTRRWQRLSRPELETDPIQALRACIAEVRAAPQDLEARRRLRALAAEPAKWDAARAAARRRGARREVARRRRRVLRGARRRPREPRSAARDDRRDGGSGRARARRRSSTTIGSRGCTARAGAWQKAADAFERVATLAHDDRARAALRAAGKLYRDNGRLDRAADVYRAIVERRPCDLDAWRALDAAARPSSGAGARSPRSAARSRSAPTGVEKAALLRAQARALEQAGDASAAAELVAHAPRRTRPTTSAASSTTRSCSRAAARARGRAGAARRASPRRSSAARRPRTSRRCARGSPASSRMRAAIARPRPPCSTSCSPTHRDHLPALERLVWHASHDPRSARPCRGAAAPGGGDARRRRARDMLARSRAARARRRRSAHRAARPRGRDRASSPIDDELQRRARRARIALVVDRAAADATAGEVGEARAPAAHDPRRRAAPRRREPRARRLARTPRTRSRPPSTCGDARDRRPTTSPACSRARPSLRGRACGARRTRRGAPAAARGASPRSPRPRRSRSRSARAASSAGCGARPRIHLGSLAEHPDAPRHARASRRARPRGARRGRARCARRTPRSATRRRCGSIRSARRAWHALAELAIERGDMERAAECLEREATATTEPADRLRLFDALGDLALDVLGDPARAERCWAQVADRGRRAACSTSCSRVQRRRGARIERGETCERLALLVERRARPEGARRGGRSGVRGGRRPRARAQPPPNG